MGIQSPDWLEFYGELNGKTVYTTAYAYQRLSMYHTVQVMISHSCKAGTVSSISYMSKLMLIAVN